MQANSFQTWLGTLLVAVLTTATPAAETKVSNVAEFDAAVKAAKPGDAIVMADGEWRDADLVFVGFGEEVADRRITLRAATPGKVVLTGTSRLRIGGRYLAIEGLLWKNTAAKDQTVAFRRDSKTLADDCTLRECAIIDDAPVDDGGDRKWVSLYGRRNVVHRCRFEGKQSAGALMVVWIDDAPLESKPDPAAHRIERSFFGPRKRLGKNGGETIRIGDSKTSLHRCETHVTQNYFYQCDGEAEIISNKSCGNIYRGNAFIGCSGALTLRHGNDCRVEENLFNGDNRKGTGGVRVIGEGHLVRSNTFEDLLGEEGRAALCIMNGIPQSPLIGYAPVRRLRIERNQFIVCKQSIVIGVADKDRKEQTVAPDDVRFFRNVAGGVDEGIVFTVRTPATNLTHVDNCFYSGKLGIAGVPGWTKSDVDLHDFPINECLSNAGPAWLRPN